MKESKLNSTKCIYTSFKVFDNQKIIHFMRVFMFETIWKSKIK